VRKYALDANDSIEDWDRGEKLEHYQRLHSLRECVLVAHRERRVDVASRAADGSWTLQTSGPGETIALAAVGCALPVDEEYRNVDVPA
jgi:Uma2 family endonuclease